MDEIVQFDFPTDSPKIIKVIGVGGGGGNAVNHMYREGIHDVTFVLCNTDNQALAESPVPVKLQLGRSITQGLGAGNRPERARDAAEESIEDIRNQLNDGTKMVFITAGMGGGTGTGAAPVIARIGRNGWWNRNRRSPCHCPHRKGDGYSDSRYRYHPLYLRRGKENYPSVGRCGTYRSTR